MNLAERGWLLSTKSQVDRSSQFVVISNKELVERSWWAVSKRSEDGGANWSDEYMQHTCAEIVPNTP